MSEQAILSTNTFENYTLSGLDLFNGDRRLLGDQNTSYRVEAEDAFR